MSLKGLFFYVTAVPQVEFFGKEFFNENSIIIDVTIGVNECDFPGMSRRYPAVHGDGLCWLMSWR